jgi:GPN-loop GTPase
LIQSIWQYSLQLENQASFHSGFQQDRCAATRFALEWMSDFEFQAALASHSGTPGRDSEAEPIYMNSLMNSMSLVLDEFYKNLKVSKFPHFFSFVYLINNIQL